MWRASPWSCSAWQTALARAEACLLRQPQAAACHYALGAVLGVQALSEGMLNNSGQAAKAAAYFERLSKERPGHATGPYGLARVQTEDGAFDEAIKLFELSATLKGAEMLPVDYRKGIALQQAGRNDAAKVALKSFVAAGKGQKSSMEDARKRIEQLGG